MNTTGIIGHTNRLNHLERIISSGMIPQTLLFTGNEGIGKSIIAERFASSFFCKSKNSPCLKCRYCMQIKTRTFPDLLFVEPNDKGKIPIGDKIKKEEGSIRWVIEKLNKKSFSSKRIVIIDGVDKIFHEGQNALLKTIEEPPEGTFIILITSNKTLLLPTIISRSTEISFQPLTDTNVEEILKIKGVEEKIPIISKISSGSMRLAFLLSEEDVLQKIINFTIGLSNFNNNNTLLSDDIMSNLPDIDMDDILSISINIFRLILISNIKKEVIDSSLSSINPKDIKKIIKILLIARKGFTNNLNILILIKSLFYSEYDYNKIGIPEPDFLMNMNKIISA